MTPTLLVSATRLSQQDFWQTTLLGQSLKQLPDSLRPELALCFDNHGPPTLGLPVLYNRALESCPKGRHLLLVHDDVWIHDTFLQRLIDDGLQHSDVLGLAGSRNSDPLQPSWGLSFGPDLECLGWQSSEQLVLSGAVSHTTKDAGLPRSNERAPAVQLSRYGPTPAACDLLDGLFIALHRDRVRETGVSFDERFDFHLYDIDFCRSARAVGLRLSTWPILVTHGSGGDFASPDWKRAAYTYLEKWSRQSAQNKEPNA